MLEHGRNPERRERIQSGAIGGGEGVWPRRQRIGPGWRRECEVGQLHAVGELQLSHRVEMLPDISHRDVGDKLAVLEVDLQQQRAGPRESRDGLVRDEVHAVELDASEERAVPRKSKHRDVRELLAPTEVDALQFRSGGSEHDNGLVGNIVNTREVEGDQVLAIRKDSCEAVVRDGRTVGQGQSL